MMRKTMQKTPEADEQRSYILRLELGYVVALAVAATLFSIPWTAGETPDFGIVDTPVITIDDVPKTEIKTTPPAPVRPVVPVSTTKEEVVDDIVDIPDFSDGLNLAPIAPPATGTPDEEPEFVVIPEFMPEVIGGMQALNKHIVYPELARRVGVEGKVMIELIVDERGRPTNLRVVRGIGMGCDDAAVAAVAKAKFKPGLQRGRPVKVKMVIPVTFKLSS
jgi:protein TonB